MTVQQLQLALLGLIDVGLADAEITVKARPLRGVDQFLTLDVVDVRHSGAKVVINTEPPMHPAAGMATPLLTKGPNQ